MEAVFFHSLLPELRLAHDYNHQNASLPRIEASASDLDAAGHAMAALANVRISPFRT